MIPQQLYKLQKLIVWYIPYDSLGFHFGRSYQILKSFPESFWLLYSHYLHTVYILSYSVYDRNLGNMPFGILLETVLKLTYGLLYRAYTRVHKRCQQPPDCTCDTNYTSLHWCHCQLNLIQRIALTYLWGLMGRYKGKEGFDDIIPK